MSDFRKFSDQMEYSGEPSAKLYKNGKIRFNKIAGELWFSDTEHVEIFVSDNSDELAFRPAPATREGTYSYGRDGKGHAGHLSVRSVLSKYGIWHERMDESIAIPVRYDDAEELVVVDLSEAVERWGVASPESVRRKQGGDGA